MADVIKKSTNKFTKGLIMDFSPENTQNEVLTHALNATLLTFNGNELSLQNDMGNARVETAYLPEGYMPVGTCEYGGIIYIVSYNPLEDKSLIGCFPSPERNISSDELGISELTIKRDEFQFFENGKPNGTIINNTQRVLLKNDNLNPGDKFLICSENSIYNEKLADLWVKHYEGKIVGEDSEKKPIIEYTANENSFGLVDHPIISLNIVSIEDSGKIIYLNSDVTKYNVDNIWENKDENDITHYYKNEYNYHILGKMMENTNLVSKDDLDSYRNVLSSGYSVFKSKTSGKLAILAELIMIDLYSVTHEICPRKDELGKIIDGIFDIIVHTDITPTVTLENYNQVPKLQYYYLQNSLGYILVYIDNTYTNAEDSLKESLFEIIDGKPSKKLNSKFLDIKLSDIYVDTSNTLSLNTTLKNSAKFNFPKSESYHGRMVQHNEIPETLTDTDKTIYTKFTEGLYQRIKKHQVESSKEYFLNNINASFYYYEDSEKDRYQQLQNSESIKNDVIYYVKEIEYSYYDAKRDDKYKSIDLYKMETQPQVASDKEINDSSIEKYLYVPIESWRLAKLEEINTTNTLYLKTEVDGKISFIEVTTIPDPSLLGEYYIKNVLYNLHSIGTNINKDDFLGNIYYYPTFKNYILATLEEKNVYFDKDTYPYESTPPYGSPITLYWRDPKEVYTKATDTDIQNYLKYGSELYYDSNYKKITNFDNTSDTNNLWFIVVPMDSYVSYYNFVPNKEYNYIDLGKDQNGNSVVVKPIGVNEPKDGYPDEYPITLYTIADFIPNNENDVDNNLNYDSLKLASIKLPQTVVDAGLDLPFKYDYTLVPCMNYGRLSHLAVSNTVDFSKLRAFNQSDFTIWKYRIDENLLRLTFGAEVFDTYETDKVDGLVLEFYDIWGFAGSLEIEGKKAYSGIFTKLISLNTLNALSKKKILGNQYIKSYIHNINIKEEVDSNNIPTGNFFFNENSEEMAVNYNSDNGWIISEKYNDCGTLYSNILYGVKTYLRRTKQDGTLEFIKKKDFFLYTLPIYNDFYYTCDDFSTLYDPLIELMLTYKLLDNGTKISYSGNLIIDGYNPTDKDNIDLYLSGFYEKNSLDVIKYYKYSGITNLYLEIGLKKDYESVNLSYDSDLNKYFKCKLLLISDDNENKTFTVNSGLDDLVNTSQILNYVNNSALEILLENINTLGFINSNESISNFYIPSEFIQNNFINNIGTTPIQIKYDFIVGYKASITDIRTTQVPTTTICALCHKRDDGTYNYNDFGIYEPAEGLFLSEKMLYNSGTKEIEKFGICTQKAVNLITTKEISALEQEIVVNISYELEALQIKAPGNLNTGEPLKYIKQYLGKLTFCLPHVLAIDNINGVSIEYGINTNNSDWEYNYSTPLLIRNPESDTRLDSSETLLPGNNQNGLGHYQSIPRYNLSLNTKNAINQTIEFISTLDWATYEDPFNTNTYLRIYTGFTGYEVSEFNKKLLTTMKSIYVYNPDYDLLSVNVGNITLQNYNPFFTSNLINTQSFLDFGTQSNLTFNDFIYLGPFKFSSYLRNLTEHSKTSINISDGIDTNVPLVRLLPNYTYCGTSANPYLISALTYNTPIPLELESELEFNASNTIVVKHEDGTNVLIKGTPNKKALYGYNKEFNKLVELDISNYEIDPDGNLTLKNVFDNEKKNFSHTLTDNDYLRLSTEGYSVYNGTFEGKTSGTSTPISTTINFSFYKRIGTGYSYLTPKKFEGSEYLFIIIPSSADYNTKGFSIKLPMYSPSSSDYKYSSDFVQFKLDVTAGVTNTSISELLGMSLEELEKKMEEKIQQVLYLISGGVSDVSTLTFLPNGVNIRVKDNEPGIEIYKLKITEIKWEVTRSISLNATVNNIIKTTKTTSYSNTYNNKYEVWSVYNNARIRGTSLTLNDLEYDPNKEGHRLFVSNNSYYSYNSTYGGKIYYRTMNLVDNKATNHDSWNKNTLFYNCLYFYTGPCFTTDNLNNDEEQS